MWSVWCSLSVVDRQAVSVGRKNGHICEELAQWSSALGDTFLAPSSGTESLFAKVAVGVAVTLVLRG